MFSVLAGCGDSAGNPSGEDGKEEGDKVTLTYYSWYTRDDMQPIIDAFEQEHPDIKINYNELIESGTSNDSMKKLDMLLSSGENIDIIHFNGPDPYVSHAYLDLMEPLKPMLEEEGVKYEDVYKADAEINGDIYGLPGSYEDRFVLLNKDYLDEADLPVPTDWTWDEFMDYAKKLTKGEGPSKRYGTYFHTWPEYEKLALANQAEKNTVVLYDGTVNMDDPGVGKSLEIRDHMENVDKSAVPYSESISQKLHYRPLYMTGKVAMIITGNWMAAESGGTDKFPAEFNTVFAPYPRNSKDDPIGYNPAATDFMSVSVKSNHKKEAYEFIRFYTTKGLDVQGKQFSAWKEQKLDAKIDDILKNAKTPEKVDKASLLYTMENSKTASFSLPTVYQAEVNDAFHTQFELFILKQQNLETTLAKAKEAIQKVVDNNK